MGRWGDLMSHSAGVSVLGTLPVCDTRELEMGHDTLVVLHWSRENSVQILAFIFIIKKFCYCLFYRIT